MEDYKKKYEELEFLIKNLYPTMSDYQKEKVEGIFPELRESEEEELEEEISNYIKDNFFGSVSMGFFSNRTNQELDSIDVVNIAYHFAEWQKQQMVEKAVEWIQNNIAKEFCFDEDLRASIPEFIEEFKKAIED